MSYRTPDWDSVTIRCWNYRKDGTGISREVSIGKDRFCQSNCDCEQCPLNKFHTLIVPEPISNEVKKE
jgi:hypothetical protein